MTLKTQGFILIDVDVVALNNAGKSSSSNFDNAVATKTINKNGRTYPYVSGQAWRYWWRETLRNNHGWRLSPITRENKVAYTDADPFKYDDDDVFGYMKATKDAKVDENGSPVADKKGKPVLENATVTRTSPLKNSAIVAVGSTRPEEHWSTMSRQDGDPVPYSKQEYSAIMKGMFSLDLGQVGTFSTINRTGFKNLTAKQREEALNNDSTEINDEITGHALVQLGQATRLKRSKDTITALKTISGGAMQTNNLADVTPKFVVLATTKSGNHPFSHVAKGEVTDRTRTEAVLLNVDGLKEVLKEYKDQIVGTVFVGKRSGFMDEYNTDLQTLSALGDDYPPVQFVSVGEAIDGYCKQLDDQLV
jgi:CRISPR-associated protein Cst2